jgi:hypothetical protein
MATDTQNTTDNALHTLTIKGLIARVVAGACGDKAAEQNAPAFTLKADAPNYAYITLVGTLDDTNVETRVTRRCEFTHAGDNSTAGISVQTVAHALGMPVPELPSFTDEQDAHIEAVRGAYNAIRSHKLRAGTKCPVRRSEDPRYWELISAPRGENIDA